MNKRHDSPARLPGSPGRVRAAAARLSRPFLGGLVVLAFVALTALLVTRGQRSGATPLEEAEVGQVAKADVRATQPLYVADLATTQRLQDEAERKAPLIYARDPTVAEQRVAALRRAFSLMRAGFERYDHQVQRAQTGRPPPAEESPSDDAPPPRDADRELEILERAAARGAMARVPTDGPETPAGRALPEAERRSLRERLERFVREALPELRQLLPMNEPEISALVRMRFSLAAEARAVRLLAMVLDGLVVRDKVKFLLDLRSRVLLRTEGSAVLAPLEKVLAPAEVLEVQGARAKIADVAADQVADLPSALREVLTNCARRLVTENLFFDQEATARQRQQARDAVPAQFRHYPMGSVIVRQGDVISPAKQSALQALAPASTGLDATRTFFGHFFFAALLAGLSYVASRIRVWRRTLSARDYFFLGVVFVFALFLTRISLEVSEILHERWAEVPLSAFFLAIPISFGALFVRLFFATELAVLVGFVTAFLVGLMTAGNLAFAAYVGVSGVAAALLARRARSRGQLLRSGLWVGLVQMTAVFGLSLASGQRGFPIGEASLAAGAGPGLFELTFLLDLAASLISGAIAGVLVAALSPVVEATLGYTTDIKYLELANLANPLLKDLLLRAPGTYHHSVVAGTLAEAAAEAIGANASLARVAAYYHDVAKGRSPHYFAENLRGENPHEKLTPTMSALILKNHVKEGVEILSEHRMPQPIIDICEQHLGTTLIEFFFEKAERLAEVNDLPPPEESDFRYPGPKPQFRESALVFLADSVEAASRAIADPSEPKLSEMVRRIIRGKFSDGQLEECDLTLRDLNAIAKAMTRVLLAIHHGRPRYPSQAAAEAQAPAGVGRRADSPIDLAEHRRRLH